ncbi:MAG: hypothetical protein AAB588_01320 [Patescibacteria group bacterium]
MERRGSYQKGHAGHPRNVGAYRLARQNFKKWRVPLTAVMALMFVFGAAPVVGDEFQTSLITAGETAQTVRAHPQEAKKVLLSALGTFVRDCERFKMTECHEHGRALIADIANAGDLEKVLPSVDSFEAAYEVELARNACEFDLGRIAANVQSAQKEAQAFADRYSQSLSQETLASSVAQLSDSVSQLQAVVKSCISR